MDGHAHKLTSVSSLITTLIEIYRYLFCMYAQRLGTHMLSQHLFVGPAYLVLALSVISAYFLLSTLFCEGHIFLLPWVTVYASTVLAGFSLKRVRVVLHHPGVSIFPLMWLFLIKKTQFYFDLSTTITLAWKSWGEPWLVMWNFTFLVVTCTYSAILNPAVVISHVSLIPVLLLLWKTYYIPGSSSEQCGLQNLNTEGMHVVQSRSHTYFTNDWHLSWQNFPSKMQLMWGA